jgi:DNA-binding transcriptional LysR family regulator
LTVHQLEVFITVADHMSIRRAAEQLTVSQPAVSASLAALQRELGVELFARQGRGIELTEAGKTMLRYAQLVVGLVDEALEEVRAVETRSRRPVRIGATTASAAHVITPMLARIRDLQPTLAFELEIANRAVIWQSLARRAIDLAISTRPPATQGFTSLAVRANSFVLVAKPGLVWAGRLADVTWLLREEGSGTRSAIDEVMARLDVHPTTLVIGSNEALQRSAESGLGVALLPADVVVDAVRRRDLVVVRTEATPLMRPWHLVARADEDMPVATRELVRDLVQLGGEFTLTNEGAALVDAAGR